RAGPGGRPGVPVRARNTATATRAGPSARSRRSSKVVGRYGPTVVPDLSREEPPKRATPISAAIPHWAETVRGATRPAARQVTTSVRIVPPASGLFHLQPDPAVGDGILTLHDPV